MLWLAVVEKQWNQQLVPNDTLGGYFIYNSDITAEKATA